MAALTIAVVTRGPRLALQQRPAGQVVLVGTVGGGHQGAGIDDQRSGSRPNPSASIAPASTADTPEVNSPMPANASTR